MCIFFSFFCVLAFFKNKKTFTDNLSFTRRVIFFAWPHEQPFITAITVPFETLLNQNLMLPFPFPILIPSDFFVTEMFGKNI